MAGLLYLLWRWHLLARQTVTELLELAARAPSGGNVQPWKVYVLGPRKRDELVSKVAERIAEKRFESEACKSPYRGVVAVCRLTVRLCCDPFDSTLSFRSNLPCADGTVGRREGAVHGLSKDAWLPDVLNHGGGA